MAKRPSQAAQNAAPVTPEMAEKLAINRAGRLTPAQRRTVMIAGIVAVLALMCPLALLVQFGALVITGTMPAATIGGIFFTALGLFFVLLFGGLAWTHASMFVHDAFGKQPVRWARGPLQIRVPERNRPELPFSYIIDDYSFAPYVPPPDTDLRRDVPYIVYYAAHSRIFLSIAALDAPDAARWLPAPDQEKDGNG
jgi:hypothetical protein